jgi:glycine/betaine/sarcosine/D-proline reductase family selenoprotein B
MSIENDLGFASDEDVPTRYMQRTRDWYLALGYGNPYKWAHYSEVPFQSLAKPLRESCVALITTAAPFKPEQGDQSPGAPYNAEAKFYKVYTGDISKDHDLRITHVAIDRLHTTMEDSGTWFPLPAMREAVTKGLIGQLSKRFYGLPTNRSQRHTIDVDCPEILRHCREDGVEAVVLVANCPVCHQTCSLVARYLEAAGIPTIIMACAKDIVEHVGVPRMLFSDFPLGNAAGKPKDKVSQAITLELALRTLEAAPAARTTVQSPLRWSASYAWKRDYSNVECVQPEELARLRAENDRAKEAAKKLREDL